MHVKSKRLKVLPHEAFFYLLGVGGGGVHNVIQQISSLAVKIYLHPFSLFT